MILIKNKIISWGIRGIIVGFATLFIPGAIGIAIWPLSLATGITGKPSDFVFVAGFFGLPNMVWTMIMTVGWFLVGSFAGYCINKFSEKNI